MYEDDAENARAALRALWSASGQMDGADSLGQEKEFAGVNIPTEGGNDGKGSSEQHQTVGLQDFAQNNDPTFDRGEAATKLKEAWRSTLTAEGKMGSQSKSLGATAKETTKKLKPGSGGASPARPGSVDEA